MELGAFLRARCVGYVQIAADTETVAMRALREGMIRANVNWVRDVYWKIWGLWWSYMQCQAKRPERAGYTKCLKHRFHFGEHVNYWGDKF